MSSNDFPMNDDHWLCSAPPRLNTPRIYLGSVASHGNAWGNASVENLISSVPVSGFQEERTLCFQTLPSGISPRASAACVVASETKAKIKKQRLLVFGSCRRGNARLRAHPKERCSLVAGRGPVQAEFETITMYHNW